MLVRKNIEISGSRNFKQVSLDSGKIDNIQLYLNETEVIILFKFFCNSTSPKVTGRKKRSLLALLLLPVWLYKVTSSLKKKKRKEKRFGMPGWLSG